MTSPIQRFAPITTMLATASPTWPESAVSATNTPRTYGQDRLPDAIPFPTAPAPELPTSDVIVPTPKYV